MISTLMRRFRKHTPHLEWEEINQHFKFTEKESLVCGYCGKKVKAFDIQPYRDVISLDHKKPLSQGGKNELKNIIITCCQCNIVKGTMDSELFKKFVKHFETAPELKKEVFEGLFWGRKANKVNREVKKKQIERFLHEFL